MSLVNFDVPIRIESALRSDNVMVFVGATDTPPAHCTSQCPDHYMLTMAITPRPPRAWATLEEVAEATAPMGDLMLIPPGFAQRGGFEPQSGLRRDIFCLFPKQRFEDLMGGPIAWTRKSLGATSDIHDTNLQAATRRLAQEAMTPGMAASVLSDSLAATVAVDVRRYFGIGRGDACGRYQLSAKQLTLIRDYIHANAHQELRLNQVAQLCGLSVRHLTRAFRSTTGTTLAGHVSEVRMSIAKDLLLNTRLPQKAIAANVGFANVSSFSSAFRKLTGITPDAYRRCEPAHPASA
ncbi:MAG TPA: AraC family transcriptional regulator [Steroidobacteraceae bacterium]|nr:AraC family transcriptional regulator [Steroidobacteraceae bacterium]